MTKYVVLVTFEVYRKGTFGRKHPERFSLWQAGIEFGSDADLLYHYGEEAQARGATILALHYAPWDGSVAKKPPMSLDPYLPKRKDEAS